MRTRRFITVLVAALVVAALAATAFAVGGLNVVAQKSTVTYPHHAMLRVTTPAAVAETITIQARPIGGDWSVVKTIPAARAAHGTTFTVSQKLKVTSGVRAVQAGIESEVVTIGVKASLSSLSITHKKGGTWTVKGSISPAHALGTSITVKAWEQTVSGKGKKRAKTLTPLSDLTATVYKTNGQVSWYKTTFTPTAAGTYVFKAYHSDAGHVESSSKSATAKLKK